MHPDFPEYAYRYVDIHVEDHEQPIAELRRLYEMYEAQGLVQAHMRFAEQLRAVGDSLAAHREWKRVGDVLGRVMRLEAKDAGMLNSLAWFTAINDVYLDQALEAARLAVELEPENANIYDTLAEVYFRQGDVEQAIAAGTRALELSPDDDYLMEQLARFRGTAGRP